MHIGCLAAGVVDEAVAQCNKPAEGNKEVMKTLYGEAGATRRKQLPSTFALGIKVSRERVALMQGNQ
jgi:hypothetical protein